MVNRCTTLGTKAVSAITQEVYAKFNAQLKMESSTLIALISRHPRVLILETLFRNLFDLLLIYDDQGLYDSENKIYSVLHKVIKLVREYFQSTQKWKNVHSYEYNVFLRVNTFFTISSY